MNPAIHMRPLIRIVSLAASLLVASVAQAHLALESSTPAADTSVSAPQQIDLVFNEKLVQRASRLELNALDNGGAAKAEHFEIEVINDGKTLRATPHHSLKAGTYQVQWRAVGEDNHPVTGEFEFTVE